MSRFCHPFSIAPGLLTLALLAGPCESVAWAKGEGGHGGGGGHLGAAGGNGGFGRYGYGGNGGYGGYGYGRGYGYGWGGWGFGLGLGLGLGLGYPYYGYPYYDYPYYGYPYYGYPYAYGYIPGAPGAPYAAGSPPMNPGAPPLPVVPTVGAGEPPAATGPDSEVTLIVRAPADAIVWINGVKSTQTGVRREFVSSGLAPGRNYTFDLRAQWQGADGKPAVAWRRLPVQAGERRLIDLTAATQPNVTTADFGGSK